MGDLQKQIAQNQEKAAAKYELDNVDEFKKMETLQTLITSTDLEIKNGTAKDGVKVLNSRYKAQLEALENKLKTGAVAARLKKAAEDEMTYGKYAANRAVASRYYSHDLAVSRNAYYDAKANALLAADYYDTTKEASAFAEGLANRAVAVAGAVVGGPGK
jgi:hypothetical protein